MLKEFEKVVLQKNKGSEFSMHSKEDQFLVGLMRDIKSFEQVSGGLVHNVYKLKTQTDTYFIKHRGDRFAQLDQIICNPNDIKYEYLALQYFHNNSPNHFPKVLHFCQDEHFLIMSDVIRDGHTLRELFRKNEVTTELIGLIAKNVRHVLESAQEINEPIHSDEDNPYNLNLFYRLGYQNNAILNKVIQQLSFEKSRQLILGDVSPQNIGVNESQISFFDLEGAHYGNAIFDYAFLLGHIILHSYRDADQIQSFVEKFTSYFPEQEVHSELFKKIVVGTIMYRLKSVIPYNIDMVKAQKNILYFNCENILKDIDDDNISWNQINSRLLNNINFHQPNSYLSATNEQIVYEKNKDNQEISLNITNDCPNSCVFCIKDRHVGWNEGGNDNLFLKYEPNVEEIVNSVFQAINVLGINQVRYIKYCGYGDPLLRPQVIIESAKKIKTQYPEIFLQINTSGWVYYLHEDDELLNRLKDAGIDKISVSLNASNANTYSKVCRPNEIYAQLQSFQKILDFTQQIINHGIKVRFTVVEIPGVDVELCRKVAADLGVEFLSRKYHK